MKKKWLFYFILFIQHFVSAEQLTLPEFDSAHQLPNQITQRYNIFKKMYEKHRGKTFQSNKTPLIPFKIHQVWIGPKPVPNKFKWMMDTCKNNLPGWEYKLWTNKDLDTFNLENQKAFDQAPNWGMKSDIFRLEILKKYGGIYLDTDFECIKPFDVLNCNFEFYSCLINQTDEAANGIIATYPNHPIIEKYIETIKGSTLSADSYESILEQTGPRPFSKIIADFILNQASEKIIILPSSFFFPFPAHLRFEFWKGTYSRTQILSYLKPHSYAIHYWATSWQE